jgi:hypothetical protein|tara:strand:+ start:1063 stop:1317 length:255 start_codon:yes stop_codon:yes gene_type:complete
MKEEHRSNLHTFCLVLCTTTFMVYTYLYKQDVNIKRRMLNSYDIISTEDISTNTISLPTTPKTTQTTSTIKFDLVDNINNETIN